MIVLGETVRVPHLTGILLIIVGIVIISRELANDADPANSGGLAPEMTDILLPFGAALFYGIEPIFAKIGFAHDVPILIALSIKVVAATIGFLGYLLWSDALSVERLVRVSHLKWYVAAGVNNTVFLLFLYSAVEIGDVSVVIPIVQTSPLFVLVFSYLFLPRLEHVTWRLVGASLVVVFGAIGVTVFG